MNATAAASCLLAVSVTIPPAHADTFGSGPNAFTIDFVHIGNAGNGDGFGFGGAFGGVPYAYRMGKYEISQEQITKATAGGLLNVTAGAWGASQPAADMTWYEAAAFVNWLNDQRTPGLRAYNLNPFGGLTPWDVADAWTLGGVNRYRHKDAYYFLPSEDEWVKAAYHKNDGVTANYWDYATGSNSIPTAVASGTAAGTVVYNFQANPANVIVAGGLSAYGTMGQNGNVVEWTESPFEGFYFDLVDITIRGGSWLSSFWDLHREDVRFSQTMEQYGPNIGFRVASVPEPSSTVLMISGGLLALSRRRRRRAL